MNGSTCSFLTGTALCIYAIASHLYRDDFPLAAAAVLAVIGVSMIVAGLVQLMIERWGVPLDPVKERPRR